MKEFVSARRGHEIEAPDGSAASTRRWAHEVTIVTEGVAKTAPGPAKHLPPL